VSWRHSDVSRGGVSSNWLAIRSRVGWSVCCSVCWTSLTNRRTVWTLLATVCPTVCATVAQCERYGRLLDKLSVQLSQVVFTLCNCCTDSLSNSRIVWTAYNSRVVAGHVCVQTSTRKLTNDWCFVHCLDLEYGLGLKFQLKDIPS